VTHSDERGASAADGLDGLTILRGNACQPGKTLETFPRPQHVHYIRMESDEVTGLCPITGQPDWYTVRIEYGPNDRCIESKSLKLYLWSFREEGCFCEELADQIAADVDEQAGPRWVEVTLFQKPRGGISIEARARRGERVE